MIIGSNQIYLPQTASTNSFLARLSDKDHLPEGTIVRAGYQTSGKGQKNNSWESEADKNLTFSILLYPNFLQPSLQFFLSMSISLGIAEYLNRYTDNCRIKWPNDIYVNDDKIAGILIENSLMGSEIKSAIAGIGLNVNQVNFTSKAPNPVSLKTITGKDHDLEEEFKKLVSCLDKHYKQLIGGDHGMIRNEYIDRLFRLKEWSRYSDAEGFFKGMIRSVTGEGNLQIERSGGKMNEYAFREVEFIL